MIRLHFGVLDFAYSENQKNVGVGQSRITTTGFVAEILEEKYHVMRVFAELYQKEIAEAVGAKLMGMLQNDKIGGPAGQGDIFFPKIERMFRNYLDKGEWEKVSGQPTQAALNGVNHRKKRPYVKSNPSRPSFIDTGQYQSSIKIWMDSDGQ